MNTNKNKTRYFNNKTQQQQQPNNNDKSRPKLSISELKKMSDWGDESAEESGKGFGGSTSNYKSDDNGTEEGNGERRYGGGGRGRGGMRGRGGRGGSYGGGGGGGGGYNDRNGGNDDYNENGEHNELQDSEDAIENSNIRKSQKNINFIPHDYKNREVVEHFLDANYPELWNKANLLEIMALHHFIVMAFQYHVQAELSKNDLMTKSGGRLTKKSSSNLKLAEAKRSSQCDLERDRDFVLKSEFMRHFDAFKCTAEDDDGVDYESLPAIPVEYLQELQRTAIEDAQANPLEHTFRDANLFNLDELPELKATELPKAAQEFGGGSATMTFKNLAAGDAPEASDSSEDAEQTLRRSVPNAPRKRLTEVVSRLARKQQAASSRSSLTPTPPYVLRTRPITDRMHLRERLPRQCFARIVEPEHATPINYAENTSAYYYFPLYWPMLRLARTRLVEATASAEALSTLETYDYSLSVNVARQNVTSSYGSLGQRIDELMPAPPAPLRTTQPPPPPAPVPAPAATTALSPSTTQPSTQLTNAFVDQSNDLNLIFNEAETVHIFNEFDITAQTERAAATAASFGLTTDPSLNIRYRQILV